jgi:predicted Fe-Mo cluster-binding NifX family protein
MKIAFTTKGTEWDSDMDPRFGRTEWILVYDEETKKLSSIDDTDVSNEAHGAGPRTAQRLFELEPDVLITGNGPGGNAGTVLTEAGIVSYIGAGEMTVKEAFDAFKNFNDSTEITLGYGGPFGGSIMTKFNSINFNKIISELTSPDSKTKKADNNWLQSQGIEISGYRNK